jgi:hypothetical protein
MRDGAQPLCSGCRVRLGLLDLLSAVDHASVLMLRWCGICSRTIEATEWAKHQQAHQPRRRDKVARAAAIQRDPRCKRCGDTRTANLEVHHLNGNRYDDRLANLIVLCCDCHREAEAERRAEADYIPPRETARRSNR